MKFRGFLLVLFLFSLWRVSPVFSQKDTVISLPVVEINSTRLNSIQATLLMSNQDSQFHNSLHNLGDILAAQSPFFIKNYGPSNLSTISIKGTDASHTSLVWNGFHLQNPMNGVIDLSLIFQEGFDLMGYQDEGGTALNGNTGIGGYLFLENQPQKIRQGAGALRLSQGSYGLWSLGARQKWKKERLAGDLSVSFQKAKNDFPIPNTGRKTQNAEIRKVQVIQNNHFQLNHRWSLKSYLWYLHADRRIPPPFFAANDQGRQIDNIFRAGASLQYHESSVSAVLRSGWFQEFLSFDNLLIAPSKSLVHTWQNALDVTHILTGHSEINYGLDWTTSLAVAENLSSQPIRQQISVFAFSRWPWSTPNITLEGGGRIHYFSDLAQLNWSGLLQSVWKFVPNHKSTLSLSRNFKAPTFNDLFWRGSGNPGLLPERGLSQSLKFNGQLPLAFGHWTYQAEWFNLLVEDWIQWIPGDNGSLWTPTNHKQVWSRGLQASLFQLQQWENWSTNFSAHYTLSRTTVEKTYAPTSNQVGKQLIYVPVHLVKFILGANFRSCGLQYMHQYSGRRFTDPTNVFDLHPFHTGNLMLSWKRKLSAKQHVTLEGSLQNLWNTRFEIVESRPMPPRNYQLSVKWQY